MAELVAEPLPRQEHTLEKTEEMNGTKRRQWLCKGRATICNKARRLEHGSSLTCNEVWHQSGKNGTAIPAALQDKIRFVNKRRPGAVRDTDEE
ncbi:hypothetical protein PF002_g7987 [Phytophthora fragariae]|uniref:Uncharacterized protein n=1 Tax=Phytophthora fragariae TaxID=53985 RepID=A0A6A3ZUV5_9STRA|nr:hypothetical protein PF002_g7987 [Phytophthora fragariae]